jgi:DNA-binding NtrC family response regulator
VLPALRNRCEDIAPLVEVFIGQMPAELRPASITDEFWRELSRRDWPGNVRELRHAVDHAVVLARRGPLRPEHLPPVESQTATISGTTEQEVLSAVARWTKAELNQPGGPRCDLQRRLLELVESSLLREVLTATKQKRTSAAKLLGLDRTTLRTRLRQLFGEEGEGT